MPLDQSFIPSKTKNSAQIFTVNSAVAGQGYQEWAKPRGASMVHMICIGGGGGGGGGFTRTTGNPGGGGGSGACSGISVFTCPASVLPDILYILVGDGGIGGAASAAGTAGTNSFILTSKTAILPNIVLYNGVNTPGGGGAGTAVVAGAAGTVPTIALTQPINKFGHWNAIVGLVGIIGGAQTGAAGSGITAWTSIPISPGGSGAGCTGASNFAGGTVVSTNLFDAGNQGYYNTTISAGGTAGTGINADPGSMRITPFFNSGGAGGGSNNSGQAGNGGNGGYGSGGGGGGAGATGGQGGNGGPGLVIITAW